MNDLFIFINVIPDSIKIGLIYSIMAMGVYITYKILNFPDMSVDGSFPLGGFVFAACSLHPVFSSSPLIGMIFAIICGALAGLVTGIFHVKFGIDSLLSGILTMIALYSVNARVVGSPSVFISQDKSVYGILNFDNNFTLFIFLFIILLLFKLYYDYNIKTNKYMIRSFLIYVVLFAILLIYTYSTKDFAMMVTAFVVFLIKLILDYILTSKFGFILRALGDNESIVTGLGVNPKKIKIQGLMIANALSALSGCMFTQYIRVIDLSSSVGTMVIGLASIIFGLGIIKKTRVINYVSIVIVGSIVYYIVINFALNSQGITNMIFSTMKLNTNLIEKLSIKPTDVKIITAILLALILRKRGKNVKIK